MLSKYFTMIGLFVVLCFSAGCGYGQALLERNWGSSLTSAKYNQIVNPDMVRKTEPVEGLDGQTAVYIMQKYREGFTRETQETGSRGSLLGIIGGTAQ